MAKPMSPIIPNHPRVVPGGVSFARWLRKQLERMNLGPMDAARLFSVSPEITRGYLRGFTVPTAVTLGRIELAVGAKYAPSASHDVVVSMPVQATAQAIGTDDVVITLKLSRSKFMTLTAAA